MIAEISDNTCHIVGCNVTPSAVHYPEHPEHVHGSVVDIALMEIHP